jgi:hypothetical protein
MRPERFGYIRLGGESSEEGGSSVPTSSSSFLKVELELLELTLELELFKKPQFHTSVPLFIPGKNSRKKI